VLGSLCISEIVHPMVESPCFWGIQMNIQKIELSGFGAFFMNYCLI